MKDEYISISEFAKRAGVSRPTIYSKLDNELSSFCKVVKGKKLLNTAALALFGVKESVKNFTDSETLKSLVTVLQEQQQALQKELDIKNEQIRTLSDQNTQQLKLIDQQQYLQAMAEQKRLEAPAERIEEEKGLFNPEKFRGEKEYFKFLCRVIPKPGFWASKADLAEQEIVLAMLSEAEKQILKNNGFTKGLDYLKDE